MAQGTQYSVITYMRTEYEKEGICVHVQQSLSCTQETQHCTSTIFPHKIKSKLQIRSH